MTLSRPCGKADDERSSVLPAARQAAIPPLSAERFRSPRKSSVKSAAHREKRGELKSGKGGTVISREQAIAIGLSEARKKGAKVPKKSSRSK